MQKRRKNGEGTIYQRPNGLWAVSYTHLDVYKRQIKDGVEKTWEEIDYQNDLELVDEIEGEDNKVCESEATDRGYTDDVYAWQYSEI